MKTKMMAFTVIVLLVGCVVLAYLWIDRSISLSYARQSADVEIAAMRRMERLLGDAWIDMPEQSVLEKLQAYEERHPTEMIVITKEENVIWFHDTRFNFEYGKLKSVGNSQIRRN